jgi:phosphomannomutase / phosphoglucomutase
MSERTDPAVEQTVGAGVVPAPELFRAYDIRGVVGRGLDAPVAWAIGAAIGTEAMLRGCAPVVVGRDGRLSGPELVASLIAGLRSTGCDVVDIGMVATPVTYFATTLIGSGSGVQVTGSHNPPDYNGFKIMLGGHTLHGEAITGLYRRLRRGEVLCGPLGRLTQRDVTADYLDRLVADIRLARRCRVVVDCGNGVAGALVPHALERLGCEVEQLYCEVDGHFPNHHPDPSDPANLVDLIARVRASGAEIGFAFDGDGDRVGVVDAGGKIIWPDRQMMLLASAVLEHHPGAEIIFDVKCSAQLGQVIAAAGGRPTMWRTGHSLIKARLKETGAPLAGEMSGHLFFNDRWGGFDDGLYAAARLLEILSRDGRRSDEVFAGLPEALSTPEIKVPLAEGEPPQVIERLLALEHDKQATRITVDGLRLDYPDGWGLVRASNTTPCLVLRFEADDQQALDRIRQRFRDLLHQAWPGLTLTF